MNEGDIIEGIVKNLTDYGAFIDLGGIDGLLHITDISWKKVKHPSQHLSIADKLKVKILALDKEKHRVSLGLKQLDQDPWNKIIEEFEVGNKMTCGISNITDYGLFVEIKDGIEGLVHVSEIDWTNNNPNPHKIAKIGDEVEVMILDIDIEKRRISLGINSVYQTLGKIFHKISLPMTESKAQLNPLLTLVYLLACKATLTA